MMDIKFREPIFKMSWNKEKQIVEEIFEEFHYWGFIKGGFGSFTCPNREEKLSQQFTGLKDKNGKEIYEGDIFNSPSGNKFIVKWNRDRFIHTDIAGNIVGDLYSVTPHIDCNGNEWIGWEVIGNIYENPELLEVQK